MPTKPIARQKPRTRSKAAARRAAGLARVLKLHGLGWTPTEIAADPKVPFTRVWVAKLIAKQRQAATGRASA